jgi:hypothetical protein
MTPPSNDPVPSGLTVDGVAIPQSIEAEGGAAVEQYVAAQTAPPVPAALPIAAADTDPAPYSHAEGADL